MREMRERERRKREGEREWGASRSRRCGMEFMSHFEADRACGEESVLGDKHSAVPVLAARERRGPHW